MALGRVTSRLIPLGPIESAPAACFGFLLCEAEPEEAQRILPAHELLRPRPASSPTLSIASAIVFSALLVVAVVEARDAHRRRR